jgi:lysyl-tRNA synthetase class II
MKENAYLNVVNNSDSVIDSIEVSISGFGKMQRYGRLMPHATAKFHFMDYSDSHYKLKVYVENGKSYADSLGYITHNCNFNDTIKVLRTDSGHIIFKYGYGSAIRE